MIRVSSRQAENSIAVSAPDSPSEHLKPPMVAKPLGASYSHTSSPSSKAMRLLFLMRSSVPVGFADDTANSFRGSIGL